MSILSTDSERTEQLPRKPCLWMNNKTSQGWRWTQQPVDGLVRSKNEGGHQSTTDAHVITQTNVHKDVLVADVQECPTER